MRNDSIPVYSNWMREGSAPGATMNSDFSRRLWDEYTMSTPGDPKGAGLNCEPSEGGCLVQAPKVHSTIRLRVFSQPNRAAQPQTATIKASQKSKVKRQKSKVLRLLRFCLAFGGCGRF